MLTPQQLSRYKKLSIGQVSQSYNVHEILYFVLSKEAHNIQRLTRGNAVLYA